MHPAAAHPNAIQQRIDCDWRNAQWESMLLNGNFVELDNEGNPRSIFGGKYSSEKLKRMSVADLRVVAIELALDLPAALKFKKDILPLVKQAVETKSSKVQEDA